MTVYPVSSSHPHYAGYAGQGTDDESGAAFQFALEEQASEGDEQGGSVPSWDYQGPPRTTPISSVLWELESKTAPLTIEEKQKALDVKSKELADEFLKFAKMTPAEKIRASVLESMGLTEEALATLPPEIRDAIEEKIKEAIMRALGFDQIANSSETAEMVDGAQASQPATPN
jgi:hypothetical protein